MTLEDARRVVELARPVDGRGLVAHHAWAADLFDEVADIDRQHHFEALACAQAERDRVVALTKSGPKPGRSGRAVRKGNGGG